MFSFSWFKGKSYEDELHDFEEKINSVATSLIKTSEENLPEGQYDLASLMNPDVCNDYVIFLGSELEKRFKKVEIEEINTAIFIGKRKKYSQKKNNNMNELDYASDTAKFNKKDLCQKVASHYIRMLNLVSAILSAVSPDKNVCSRRIKALYDSITEDVDSGFVKVCPSDDTDVSNMLYPENISELPGIKQLLNLYYFYLLQDINPSNESEKKKIKVEFEKLQDSFNAVFTSSLVKPKHIPIELHETEKKINQALESILPVHEQIETELEPIEKKQTQTDEQLEKLTNLLFDLKGQIDSLKAQNKGQSITPENIQALQAGISESMKQQIEGIKGDFTTQMKLLQDKVNSIVSEKALQIESQIIGSTPTSHTETTNYESDSTQGESDIDVAPSDDEDIDLAMKKNLTNPQEQMTQPLISVLQKTPSSESEITTMKDYVSNPQQQPQQPQEPQQVQQPQQPQEFQQVQQPQQPQEFQQVQQPQQPQEFQQVQQPQQPQEFQQVQQPQQVQMQMGVQSPDSPMSPDMFMQTPETPMTPDTPIQSQQPLSIKKPVINKQIGGQTTDASEVKLGADTSIDGSLVGIAGPTVLPSKVNYNSELKSPEVPETPETPDSLFTPDTPDTPDTTETPQLSGVDSGASDDEDIFTSSSPIETKSVKPTTDVLIGSETPIETKSVKPTSDVLIGSQTPIENETSSGLYGASDIAPVVSSLLESESESEEKTPVIVDGVLTSKQHNKLLSSVEKFIEFVDKYSNQYKMDDNFSFDLRPKTNEEIVEYFKCNNEPSSLTIRMNDTEFYEFKKAYQRLKQHYLDSTKDLLAILENKIVDKTPGNPFESEYKLRPVTNNQLNDIQIDIMRKLTLFYTRCQDYYQLAFAKLAESVKSIDEKDKNNLPQ
jgi:hypothetical protein